MSDKQKHWTMTLGQDLSAYATVDISADTDLSEANLIELATRTVDRAVFEEDWGSASGLRILAITDQDKETLREDLAVEPLFLDAGQALSYFLKGHIDLDGLLRSAVRYSIIDPVEMIEYVGEYLDGDGSSPRRMTFQARKGASMDELHLAFFKAKNSSWYGKISFKPLATTEKLS